MKMIVTILMSVIFSINIFSTEPVKIVNFSNTEWVSIYNENGIEITYKVSKCSVGCNHTLQEYILVKINNSNNQNIKLDFDISVVYGENGNMIAKSNHKSITMSNNQTIEGICDNTQSSNKLKISKIYKKNDSGATLSEVSLSNIIIE